MSEEQGFWSYVHRDDEDEGGRITQLALDLRAEYELVTGTSIRLFMNRDNIEWGNLWRSKVDDALSSVTFFIPVLTPRYFQSPECRRELNFFVRRATQLGVRELIMPILWIDVEALEDESSTDEAVASIKPFQHVRWTELRFEERASGTYRRAVSQLAQRLVTANVAAQKVDIAAAAAALSVEDSDDAPGLIDRLARTEEAMPQWLETITAIGREVEQIGQIMQDASRDMETRASGGAPMAGRLIAIRRLAAELGKPVHRIQEFGQAFVVQLHDVDDGVRILIDRAPVEAGNDPAARQAACEFFRAIRGMAEAADGSLGALTALVDSIGTVESMSRDLRPVLRTLRQGLTLMLEGQKVAREWVDLLDESPLDCSEADELPLR